VRRALDVFADAHEIELLELDIRVQRVRQNGDGKVAGVPAAAEEISVRPIARVAAGGS